MQKREKILGLVAAAVVVLGGGQYLAGSFANPFAARQAELTKLTKQVEAQRDKVVVAQHAQRRVTRWQKQSLPSDITLARSFYQNWLADLIEKVKLGNAHVQPERTVAVSRTTSNRQTITAYNQLPYTINAQGTIDQFVRFFYEFYKADLLHRVRSMALQPLKDKQIKITLTVEALVLPGASPTVPDKLGTADRLALASVEDYTKLIGARNVFQAYVPPPPPIVKAPPRVERPTPPPVAAPKPPAFDDAKHTIISAIVQVDDRPQVWVLVRTSGKLLKLFEGDSIEVGQYKGKITKISRLDVEIDSDGRRQLIALGENLRQAATLPNDEI